jgi:2-polyprenyl-3-methyl-5-hydroxy-6-metoxy-1,4-benzoquinol methylase
MTYSLGSDAHELARLDRQAEAIARPTAMLLQAAGIDRGMHVLDLGTGLGHVAMQVAAMVGPEGSVVGIDQAGTALEVARRRAGPNVRFEQGDAHEFHDPEPFDAIVARLLLFHVAQPADLVRRQTKALRDGGLMVLIDFDLGGAGSEPPVELAQQALDWIEAGFRSAGANPRIGARLVTVLRDAGFEGIETIGLQGYFAPGDPAGPAMVAGVVRSLAARIAAEGIAPAADLEGFEERLGAALVETDAVLKPPTVVGAWARTP